MVDPLFSAPLRILKAALKRASTVFLVALNAAASRKREGAMKHRTGMARRHQRPAGILLANKPEFADRSKVLERLDGAYSPHALLSYHSDFAAFEA